MELVPLGTRGTVTLLMFAAIGLLPVQAQATPNHAHYHYLVGVRAFAGTKHAAMLHHEASSEGLVLRLARENAGEMERLAAEIHERAIWIQTVQSEEEADKINKELEEMQYVAEEVHQLAGELRAWLDEAGSSSRTKLSPYFSARIVERSRVLYARFREILVLHKLAEEKLGIPVPPNPPSP